jgi:hypothetical protein
MDGLSGLACSTDCVGQWPNHRLSARCRIAIAQKVFPASPRGETHASNRRPRTVALGLREARTAQRTGLTPARPIHTRSGPSVTSAALRSPTLTRAPTGIDTSLTRRKRISPLPPIQPQPKRHHRASRQNQYCRIRCELAQFCNDGRRTSAPRPRRLPTRRTPATGGFRSRIEGRCRFAGEHHRR